MPTTNNEYDWLTYETVFNKPRFRKPNKEFEMQLYIVPRKKVTVWFRDELEDDALLETLTKAFFPEFDAKKHLKVSNKEWEWKNVTGAGDVQDAVTPQDEPNDVSRAVVVLQQPPHVVLPYNVYDNTNYSRAFGTKEQAGFKQLKKDNIWKFWKTASRSCVVRLEDVKKDASWAVKILEKWEDWVFKVDNDKKGDEIEVYRFPDMEKVPLVFLLKDAPEPTLYSLKENYTPGDVSLKTGVIFVGSHEQANKDILDDNWIVACLRSDYVTEVEKEMKGKTRFPLEQDVVILTELLSINEKKKRKVKGKEVRDGVQIRDISKLNRTKLFFGPLSIPFVDINLNLFHNEFDLLDSKIWCNYWKKHWAASLGRAKALFLLRYGLQHINPNVQNYLIEFKNGSGASPVPTGRIVIRDLQDASVHREVVWALYGNPGEAPPEGADKKGELSRLTLPVLKYEFEKALDECQETGSTDTSQFGPEGTQFLWQRFSTFANGTKIGTVKNQEPFKSKGIELLAVMAEWGIAHNRAYVGCVEHLLGINFTAINWKNIPDPERYRGLDNVDEANDLCYDVTYQSSDSNESPPVSKGVKPPKITSIGASALPGKIPWEQKLNVAFNMNLLKSADTFVTIDDVSTTPIPVDKQTPLVAAAAASCIQISGRDFQNCTVEFDGIAATNVWQTKDGRSLLAIRLKEEKIPPVFNPDDEEYDPNAPVEPDKFKLVLDNPWLKRVANKNASVTVINHEDASKTKPIGQTTCKPEPKQPVITDMGWEENEIKVIHNYLKSPDGQKAIRDYKARGWAPVAPKFRLQVLDADNHPVQHLLIRVSPRVFGKEPIVYLTDINGKVQIYNYSAEECSVRTEYGSTGSFEVKTIAGLGESTLDLTGYPEGIKIKYLK